MNNHLFYIGADTAALRCTRAYLMEQGLAIAPAPSRNVTHLILNVPTFSPDGSLVGGGDAAEILSRLPVGVTVIGGNLTSPIFKDHSTWDLLKNEAYLAENAAITAECALQLAMNQSPATIRGASALVLGWGRIGKCLSKLLGAIGVNVTVAARKEADIAMAQALGYSGISLKNIAPELPRFRILFNTIPAMVMPDSVSSLCPDNCLKIDLASTSGIGGSDVISARGLPGKMAPETAGHLIAKTIIREVST